MSSDEANVAKLRAAYAAWHDTKGDADVWYPLLAEEVSWGSLADGKPGMEFTHPRISKEEVVGYFSGLADDWKMEFYLINEYVAQNDRVVAIGECSWTHRRTGKTATIPKIDVWKFADGKVTEFMEYYDTYTALGAAKN